VLILLPPSEGKTRPASGQPLDLRGLSFGSLTDVRQRLLDELVSLCAGDASQASAVLGLGPTQAEAVEVNATLPQQPTARADRVYTGVLFGALDVETLDEPARKHADATLAITSALFGFVRPSDLIPAYRLSGTVSLPQIGKVAAQWRTLLPQVMTDQVGDGLLVDLRSGTYTALGNPPKTLADRTATMRVLHEHNGTRKVVSHFNKATKGHIVRGLMQTQANPTSISELVDVLGDLGWTVERDGGRLDVVVTEVAHS
jgi:cytoplasmic iron level regulating protein YaaA (DUF328/UPF0246 family)